MGTVEAALEREAEAGPEGASESAGPEGPAYERVVALKRLLPDAARDSRRVEMFLREAKLAAMLDHPNIVRAYDYGEVDGELFLAMEYVEGQALSRVLKALAEANAELGASLTAHVLAEVCDGLHAAHELRDEAGKELNLVHRDVSPQNVMVGCDGHVRLLDFGVAKIEAESSTKTGEVKGKTAYMSPEQAMGDAIDRRSDLFGVGAVLFECLTLRRMWGDGTDMDVIRKLALEKPPRLEEAAPSAPPALCALYTRLVARDAKDRPATAHDVAVELREFVPQGKGEAARALQELLDLHFGAQAAEQRIRLTTALEEVAPEQAAELRQSVIPELASSPDLARARPSTASIAEEAGQNPVSDAAARSKGVGAEAREGSRASMWIVLAAIALGGVAVWKVAGAGSSEDPNKGVTSVTSALRPTATAATTGPETATTAPRALLVASASAAPSPSVSASSSASGAARPPALAASIPPRVTAAQSTTPPRPSASTSAPPRPTELAVPAVSAKPPPHVDDHPF